MQHLLNSGMKFIILLCTNIVVYVAFRGSTALHMATKIGNATAVDMLLKVTAVDMPCEDRTIYVNKCDNDGFTAVYYAIHDSR